MAEDHVSVTGGATMTCGHVEARAHAWERMQKRLLPGGCMTLQLEAFRAFLKTEICGECERSQRAAALEELWAAWQEVTQHPLGYTPRFTAACQRLRELEKR